jgi:hypothetical protein
VDASELTLVVGGVEAVMRDRATGEVRKDQVTGKTMYAVHVMAIAPGEARPDQWSIRVAGEPEGVRVGSVVRVRNLVAVTWEMDDRHGLSFRADAVESVDAARPAASSGATTSGASKAA